MAKKKKKSSPQKECPSCGQSVHTRTMMCPKCEHRFGTTQKKKAKKKASVKRKRTATEKKKVSARPDVATVLAAADFIGKAGSASKAKAALDAVAQAME